MHARVRHPPSAIRHSKWSSSPTPACSTARTSSAAWQSSTRTTAKSGPSSKPAPTSTTTSSSARRSRSARSWTTSRPPRACGRSSSNRSSCASHGEPPSQAELEAFCDRLNEITAAGGQLKLVQIYTVARRPAESYVAPLTDAEVDAIVDACETAHEACRALALLRQRRTTNVVAPSACAASARSCTAHPASC